MLFKGMGRVCWGGFALGNTSTGFGGGWQEAVAQVGVSPRGSQHGAHRRQKLSEKRDLVPPPAR